MYTYTVSNVMYTHITEELGVKTALVTILDHPSQNLQLKFISTFLQCYSGQMNRIM